MKVKCKRMTALVLALAMCFSLLAPAWAADAEAAEEVTAEAAAEAVEETEEPVEEETAAAEEAAAVGEAEAEVTAEEAEDEGDAVVSAQATTSGTCGKNLTWSYSSGTLTISGTGAMTNWDCETDDDLAPWYSYSEKIQKIVVSDGVTSIGDFAFDDCYNLTSVTLGSSITSIGYDAFGGCESLSSLTIPSGVTSIGDYAFSNCSSLKKVTIPDGVTSIGEGTFQYCESLSSLTIGSGVTSIGYYAFCYCTSLKKVTIPGSVTSIGEGAFDGCSVLNSVTIGSGVKTIGMMAFYECDKLLSVTIPDSVTSIGKYAFGYVFSESSDGKGPEKHDFTIYGYTDSKAQTYAKSNGLTFVSLNPAAPKISSVTNTSSGVKVTWKVVSGASGYRIYRKAGSATSWTKVKTVSSGSTVSWTDTSVTNGTKYTYMVKAYEKSDGSTYWSAKSSSKTTYRLTGVSISSLKNSASKKMTVKWGKNSKATGYQIQYSTSSSFSSCKTVTVSSYKTVSKTISKLTKGKKYYVRVRAYKTVSGTKYYSAWSAAKNVKISK